MEYQVKILNVPSPPVRFSPKFFSKRGWLTKVSVATLRQSETLIKQEESTALDRTLLTV